MTRDGYNISLDVNKKIDYVELNFNIKDKDELINILKGNYILTIIVDSKIKEYQINFIEEKNTDNPIQTVFKEIYEEKDIKDNNYCDPIKFFNNICMIDNNIMEKNRMIIDIKSKLLNNVNLFLRDINFKENENKERKAFDIIYSIVQLDKNSIIKNNLSIIYFENCEKILREKYNIANNTKLYSFKIDVILKIYIFL